jgi:hypothetical protein
MLHALSAADDASGSPDFERLNNAIVRGARLGGNWAQLAEEWNTDVFERRASLAILPPVWAHYLNKYWEIYTKLYLASNAPQGLPEPRTIAPGGITSVMRDFYAPMLDALKNLVPTPSWGESGPVKRPVAELQAYLQKLGWPATRNYTDGKYGPTTKNAWATSAAARGLNPQFDRASGTEAIVEAQTLSIIAAGVPVIIPKPAPGPDPVPVPPPIEAPANYAPLLISVGIAGLGAWWIMRRKSGRQFAY